MDFYKFSQNARLLSRLFRAYIYLYGVLLSLSGAVLVALDCVGVDSGRWVGVGCWFCSPCGSPDVVSIVGGVVCS